MLLSQAVNAQQTEVHISDDGYVHVPLQFPFPFYDRIFTDSYMYSNGVVGFLDPRTGFCCNGQDLSVNQNPIWSYSIMPLWTDLVNYGAGSFYIEGTDEYQRYYWENIYEYGTQNSNTFKLEILPSGEYNMHHDDINITRHTYTIGATGDLSRGEYVQYVYDVDGTTGPIVVTPEPPVVDLCVSDPLSSPSCIGYEQAYYEMQCSADPLYDVGCVGYEQAYFLAQCEENPLYDSQCVGYEEAYFYQQCVNDTLYDTACPGYEEAFFSFNCALDPLYDAQCEGYQQAYIEQQRQINCSIDPLYDVSCDGYLEATLLSQTQESVQEPIASSVVVATPMDIQQIAIEETFAEMIDMGPAFEEMADLSPSETQQEEAAAVEEVEAELEQVEQQSGGNREAVKQAVVARAKSLAETVGAAVSIEQQRAAQTQLLALISYVPGFGAYDVVINGGMYPDTEMYPPDAVPDSRRGLRNGLAQQLLHIQMVDMQYER